MGKKNTSIALISFLGTYLLQQSFLTCLIVFNVILISGVFYELSQVYRGKQKDRSQNSNVKNTASHTRAENDVATTKYAEIKSYIQKIKDVIQTDGSKEADPNPPFLSNIEDIVILPYPFDTEEGFLASKCNTQNRKREKEEEGILETINRKDRDLLEVEDSVDPESEILLKENEGIVKKVSKTKKHIERKKRKSPQKKNRITSRTSSLIDFISTSSKEQEMGEGMVGSE